MSQRDERFVGLYAHEHGQRDELLGVLANRLFSSSSLHVSLEQVICDLLFVFSAYVFLRPHSLTAPHLHTLVVI